MKRVYRRVWRAYWIPVYEALDVPEGVDPTDDDAIAGEAGWEEIAVDYDETGEYVNGIDDEMDEYPGLTFDGLPDIVQEQEINTFGADQIAKATHYCDGCDHKTPGIRPDSSGCCDPPEGFVIVERCDSCELYPGDLEAAKAWGDCAQVQEGNGGSQVIARPRKGGAA